MGILNLLGIQDSRDVDLMKTAIAAKDEEIAQKNKRIEVLSNELEEARMTIENIEVVEKSLEDSQSKISELIQSIERMQRDEAINDIKKSEIQEKYNSLMEKYNELDCKIENPLPAVKSEKLDVNNVKSCNKNTCIEIVNIDINHPLKCKSICTDTKDCRYIEALNLGHSNVKKVFITIIDLIFSNTSNKSTYLTDSSFKAIDSDGFSYTGKSLCETYSEAEGFNSGYYNVPSKSKVKYKLLFIGVGKEIHSLVYRDELTVNLKETEHNTIDFSVKYEKALSNIKELKSENFKLKKEVEWRDSEIKKIKSDDAYYKPTKDNYQYKDVIRRADESFLIKYTTIEDDAYFRIISLEKNDTISFNREFDKTKGNYNWINVGDPLIKMRADNTLAYMDGVTLVKSSVSGIFEFDNNKLIGHNEEICRIKKYPQSEKESVILELEKQDIKDAIYKKERKKMIERETLDELLSEGKVFNVYTKKDGNRTTIPMDVANAVWNRDGGKCCICGKNQELEFDHIIPLSKGGATTFRNLQLLCKSCNAIKSDNI